jgi:hypothetical protein
MKNDMYLQVAYDHPIICNESAKNPTTLKGQGCLLPRHLQMTTTKNKSHDT